MDVASTNVGRRIADVCRPKLVTTLRGYTAAQFRTDVTAGVIIVIVYGIVQR